MGSLCGESNTTTQKSTNTPTGLPQLNDIWNRVQQTASTPYTPYGGPMVAGLSPTQQAGISGVTNAQGSAQPYFDQAAEYAKTGAAPIDYADIQRYQSPYTQLVVDATRRNFDQDNAIQFGQITGNAAAKGALGGDRVGVAKAEAARQQRMAQDPIIAGMYSSAYDKALGAAQQDRAASAQGAYTFGALAPSVQNAKISGSQAQIGAGGLEQGTDQARLTAAYNQYLQQQAFPYQQAGFLASAGLPAAGAMGGTSTGTSTPPSPSPWGQIAGLGLQAAMAFSDKRIKKNKREIGKTFDGQTIYSFTYGDSPQTHIGLMAQDVERHHPEAVGEVGGVKTVDYAMATDDAAKKRKFADGGPVGFFDVPTYIPKFGGMSGGSPFSSAPALPSMSGSSQKPYDIGITPQMAAGAGKTAKGFFDGVFMPEGGNYASGMSMAIPSSLTGMVGGGLKSGGRINPRHQRFHDTVHAIRQTLRRGGSVHGGYASGGSISPNDYVRHGFNDSRMAMESGDFDPQGMNAMGPAAFEAPVPAAIPMPRPRPDEAPGGLPPIMTAGTGADPDALPDALAFTRQRPPVSPFSAPPVATPSAPAGPAAPANTMGGINPFGLSDDARMALMSTGAGMMASKSPFALSAIGEGSQQGIKTYEHRRDQKQKVESEARRLAQTASQFAQNLDLHNRQLDETKRRGTVADRRADIAEKRATIPPGFRQTDDGSLEAIPGGPADPAIIKVGAEAKRGAAGLLDEETLSTMAGQYLSGDKSVMQNLGRGAQGAENIVKLRSEITRQAKEAGLKPDQIATKMADFAGRTAAMRALGTRGVNVEYAANTANKAIDIARDTYSKLPRGQFVPFNQLRQVVDNKTSSPEQAAAYAAVNTLVNEYARVASGGSNQATEGMRHHAREMLNTAMGPAAFNAVLDTMRREIVTAKAAYNETRQEFLQDSHARDAKAAPDMPGASAMPANPKKGDRFRFKQGEGEWDGTKWIPVKP